MKLFVISLFLLSSLLNNVCAQTGTSIIHNYKMNISKINSIEYAVQRIDTFGDGSVWNHTGKVLFHRNAKSNLLGINFVAHRPDLNISYFYNGNILFDLDNKRKTFSIIKNPYLPMVLGSPTGQLLVEELIHIDSTYKNVDYRLDSQDIIIHLQYPDQPQIDIFNRCTDLFIDRKTGIARIVRTSMVRGGRKWITRKLLSQVHVNGDVQIQELQNPSFLADYSPISTVHAPAKESKLIGRLAPAFQLKSFTKTMVKIRSYKGKLVVLDFWSASCTPCIVTMPKLQNIQDKYKEKLVVIGVLLDSDANTIHIAKDIVHRQKVKYINAIGGKNEILMYHIKSFPKYVVINAQGKVILDKEGGNSIYSVITTINNELNNMK